MDHYKPTHSTVLWGFLNRRSRNFHLKEIFKSNFLLSLQGERQIAFPPKFLQFDSVPRGAAMINNARVDHLRLDGSWPFYGLLTLMVDSR